MINKLIGCEYPVKDENGKVVTYRKITSADMLENVAGIVIGLDNNTPSILINFTEASQLIQKKEEGNE